MKILMMTGLYGVGGSPAVIGNLAKHLSRKGVKVTIAAFKFKDFVVNEEYYVTRLPINHVLQLRRFLNDFDILHSHQPITNYLALISRIPFIYHYHGAPNLAYVKGKRYLYKPSMLFSIKLMKHSFDAVIAVSESGAAELNQYFHLNDVHIIYNGVDTNLFKPGLEERFRKGTPQYLFIGNLYSHKKVEELLLALKELVKAYPKAYLQVVGDGLMYECLKRFVAKLKLEKHVSLVGRVSDRELPYYYASCDVYVTASRWELFGLPLLEAMACGKPVVASSIPPHAELLTKSKAGTTYTEGEIEDLCKKMIETYEGRDRYRSDALHFAKEHDWSAVADRVLKIYAQTL